MKNLFEIKRFLLTTKFKFGYTSDIIKENDEEIYEILSVKFSTFEFDETIVDLGIDNDDIKIIGSNILTSMIIQRILGERIAYRFNQEDETIMFYMEDYK